MANQAHPSLADLWFRYERLQMLAVAAVLVGLFAVPTCVARDRALEASDRRISQIDQLMTERVVFLGGQITNVCRSFVEFATTATGQSSYWEQVVPQACLDALNPSDGRSELYDR